MDENSAVDAIDTVPLLRLLHCLEEKEKTIDRSKNPVKYATICSDIKRIKSELELLQEHSNTTLNTLPEDYEENTNDTTGYEPIISRIIMGPSENPNAAILNAKLIGGCNLGGSGRIEKDEDETLLPPEWRQLSAPVVSVKSKPRRRKKENTKRKPKKPEPETPLNDLKKAYEEFLCAYFQ